MRPGTILVFLFTLVLCSAAIQAGTPALESLEQTCPIGSRAAGGLCLIGGIAVPWFVARLWNRPTKTSNEPD